MVSDSTSFLSTEQLYKAISNHICYLIRLMHPITRAINDFFYPISFPFDNGRGMKKGSISIAKNSPIVSRFGGPKIMFLLKD